MEIYMVMRIITHDQTIVFLEELHMQVSSRMVLFRVFKKDIGTMETNVNILHGRVDQCMEQFDGIPMELQYCTIP